MKAGYIDRRNENVGRSRAFQRGTDDQTLLSQFVEFFKIFVRIDGNAHAFSALPAR